MFIKNLRIFGAVFIIILLFTSVNAIGFNVTNIDNNDIKDVSDTQIVTLSSGTYNGHLRIYIVEPQSRWDNDARDPYHYGFLDFAYDDTVSIQYQDTYTDKITWDGSQAGYSNIKENNIMVMAAIFNPEINKGYADPPFQNPFDAHYVDASAGAKPGETGINIVNDDFTHTVFIEEGTATWCPYCPAMAETLNDIYTSENYEDYPFYFVALVADESETAYNRLLYDYNFAGYPSAFFDGGKKVLVGGYDQESYYRSRIESCGSRDVHELDFSVGLEWIEDGIIEIEISITNNEIGENNPPETPTINGPTSGKPGGTYEYFISSVDPEGDDVYYWVEWFEGCPGIYWDGPYKSGEVVSKNHTYLDRGVFDLSVKAKDVNDAESDWATLQVEISKSKVVKTSYIFQRIIQNYLKMYPILWQILNKIFK